MVFSTYSVGTLWVCSSFRRFLFRGLFLSGCSLFWSSIRVCLLFVFYFHSKSVVDGNDLFKPVSMYRIIANWYYFKNCFQRKEVYFLNIFPCCLSIRLFYYFLFVSIFYSKTDFFHPVVGITSFILPLVASKIIFHCFRMASFVYIVLQCLDIFLVYLL